MVQETLNVANAGESGGGGVTSYSYFSISVTSGQTTLISTSQKAKGIVFAYYRNNEVRFCYSFDGVNNNTLNVNNTEYSTVTFSDNAIIMSKGLGANLNIVGIVIY